MKKDYIVELREEEADELMNEHWVGELVKCKDCKHGFRLDDTNYIVCGRPFASNRETHTEEWFCADGVKRDE